LPEHQAVIQDDGNESGGGSEDGGLPPGLQFLGGMPGPVHFIKMGPGPAGKRLSAGGGKAGGLGGGGGEPKTAPVERVGVLMTPYEGGDVYVREAVMRAAEVMGAECAVLSATMIVGRGREYKL
jgi:hypothetical protein